MTPSHLERMQACVNGEMLDRPPVSLWRHFPVDDQVPENLARATVHFQNSYDFDLVKVSPSSSFCLKDWGVTDAWAGDSEGTRQYTSRVITEPQHWETLPVLDPSSHFLSAQLDCLQMIRREIGAQVPIIQTIFSPLAQAKNLAGGRTLLVHLRKYPQAVLKGLETISRTTQRFIESASQVGIDGIFYAVQHAQASLLSEDEYVTFGLPFDLKCIQPAQNLWCNVLHVHGQDIYFSLIQSLNSPILNWHDRDTPPSLADAQKEFSGVVCGGIARETLVYKNRNEVLLEARDAIAQTKGEKLILSTGCVVPIIAPYGNILAARRSVE